MALGDDRPRITAIAKERNAGIDPKLARKRLELAASAAVACDLQPDLRNPSDRVHYQVDPLPRLEPADQRKSERALAWRFLGVKVGRIHPVADDPQLRPSVWRLFFHEAPDIGTDRNDAICLLQRPSSKERAARIAVVMDAVLGSQNREAPPQRGSDAEDVRSKGVNVHHARAFVGQDMLQPSDIGRPEGAPQIRERIFADETSIADHHSGSADHFAQLRIGRHQRDAMIGTALRWSQREIDEEAFRPADIARYDDVNDL